MRYGLNSSINCGRLIPRVRRVMSRICVLKFIEGFWRAAPLAAVIRDTEPAPGRADAKAKVIKFGRKPALTPHQQQEARERRDVSALRSKTIRIARSTLRRTICRPDFRNGSFHR